jgi:hypothetical protein
MHLRIRILTLAIVLASFLWQGCADLDVINKNGADRSAGGWIVCDD